MNQGNRSAANQFVTRFLTDYGMVLVLLLLVLLFSMLTMKKQHPSGQLAGQAVAEQILASSVNKPSVLIVARSTDEDRLFSSSAQETLVEAGATVVAVVNGEAADARRAMEKIIADGKRIDAVAANNVTAKWTVYDRFEQVGSKILVTPPPYRWPDFLKLTNVLGVANQTAIYAIIAIGMTMVIITAGIDLSVGSLVALASVCTALLIRDFGFICNSIRSCVHLEPCNVASGADAGFEAVLVAICIGTLVCAAAGAFNGFMITVFRMPPFIVTLSMMMMASGLAFRLSAGSSIPELPASMLALGAGATLGVPNPVWLMLALYVIAHIMMSRMVFGRYVYAIGGNEEAARLSGVPVRRMLLVVYTMCGALAGLGGVVLTAKLAAGDPKFGQMYELDVIAAVVVGGTSLMGGRGRIFGTLIGAFIIAVIKNGMNLINIDPFNQKIVLGAVLLLAVLIDTPTVRKRLRFDWGRSAIV